MAFMDKGNIYLKGRQLAVVCSSSEYGVVLDDYVISGLSIEMASYEVVGYCFNPYSVPGPMTASVDIRSSGPVTTFDAHEIKKQFASPEDLTVDELLKIVYRKIDERNTDDD
jgi:hypothetical protein